MNPSFAPFGMINRQRPGRGNFTSARFPRRVELRRLELGVTVLDPQMQSAGGTFGHRFDIHSGAAPEVCQRDDRKLEPLRGVDRHHAHDVVRLLGHARFGDGGTATLLCQPPRERSQAAATRSAERARFVGQLDEVRGGLLTIAAGERYLDEARLLQRRPHELGQRDARTQVVQIAQERERAPNRWRTAVVGVEPVVEAAAGDVQIDLFVAARERTRSQAREERDLIERIVDRLKEVRQVAHLLPLEERARTFGPYGNARATKCLHVELDEHGARRRK